MKVNETKHRHNVGRSSQLWQEVGDSLLSRIVTGELAEGATLPAESALAGEYGVSRLSMRDAMKVLQEKGLVRIHHGIGSVVQPKSDWSALDQGIISAQLAGGDAADKMFDDLTTVRIALESEMVRLAALLIDEIGKSQLAELIALMDAARGDDESYLELDLQFHELIMRFSGNRFAYAIMDSLREPLRQSRRITNRIPGGVHAAQDFHRRIHERVIAGDAEGAASAMREHLTWSWHRYPESRATE